ncbi:MAG: SatD family protein [Actinomycetota bacterium]
MSGSLIKPDRMKPYASVIGDLVASRTTPDRGLLHQRVEAVLAGVNDRIRAVQPLSFTVGDEFQGLYSSVSDALDAALIVRLELLGVSDARFGLGWGTVQIFDAERLPFAQDGPAWWTAREALSTVAEAAGRKGAPRGWRTAFRGDGPEVVTAAIEAFLLCRDSLIEGMDERDGAVVLGMMNGLSQKEIAGRQGVSQSAVSQRSSRNGTFAILRAHEAIKGAL